MVLYTKLADTGEDVVFYGRVSTEEQAERGNIENQVDYARRFFDLNGAMHGIRGYYTVLDEGVSGTLPMDERPDGRELLELVKQGKVTAVYAYRLDRIARSVVHMLNLYGLLDERGVALKSMTEPFDTSTPIGKFFMTLLASIAALERETITERTQMGKARKARDGRWVTGPPPFGYRIGEDGKPVIYEPEAETVRLIFRLYLSGYSTIAVAEHLNARSIATPAVSKRTKNPTTGLWHVGLISIILRNTAYKGEYQYLKSSKVKGKEVIPIPVPPIVSREDFDQVQRLLVANADNARGRRGRTYLLRGKVVCGACGRAYVGTSGDSKAGRVYYRCGGAINHGAGKQCDAKLIRATDLEDAVWSDLQEFISNPEEIARQVATGLQTASDDLGKLKQEIADLEKSIDGVKASRARVISLMARGLITDDEGAEELDNSAREAELLARRRDDLFGQLSAHTQAQSRSVDAITMIQEWVGNPDAITDEHKAQLIDRLVRQVEVFPETDAAGNKQSRAVIHYWFADPKACAGSMSFRKLQEPYNVQLSTSWVFRAFKRSGGQRVGLRGYLA